MINMFTFDVISVYHSLGQSVTDIALFMFSGLQLFTENKIQKICMLYMFIFGVFSVCHSFSHGQSRVQFCLYFGLYLMHIGFQRIFDKIQNICRYIEYFTFYMVSVCHSLGQSVKVIDLFIFWLIPQEYSFSQNNCLAFKNMFNLLLFLGHKFSLLF